MKRGPDLVLTREGVPKELCGDCSRTSFRQRHESGINVLVPKEKEKNRFSQMTNCFLNHFKAFMWCAIEEIDSYFKMSKLLKGKLAHFP